MNSWFGKTLLLVLGTLFLLRGGIGLIVGLWRLILPLVLIGGGIYFVKKFIEGQKNLNAGKEQKSRESLDKNDREADIITICPHCLQEKGSCPKCR